MEETAKLILDGKEYEFPVIVGTEGEKGIDITSLRAKTGCITLDPGFGNTGSCISEITFMNGEKGILRYRGIPVEQLAEKARHDRRDHLARLRISHSDARRVRDHAADHARGVGTH